MHVVMYKVLAYLYDCMKKGIEPEDARWCAPALGIPESYWTAVVSQLVRHGFIDGVTPVPTGPAADTVLEPDILSATTPDRGHTLDFMRNPPRHLSSTRLS